MKYMKWHITPAGYAKEDKMIKCIEGKKSNCGCYGCDKYEPLSHNQQLCAGWRDCSEELPEEDGYYLVYTNTEVTKVKLFNLIKDGITNCGWGLCRDKNITHWMPLPDPPTGI